ncbi:MAG TPA: prenyltransferase/squalene oxidase repeat-containing protein [Solirubrobacterales bacterium]|nr:prenyltransferase/squalene oxidase repeat-containing protein [Solirubrobacterales bacterium]
MRRLVATLALCSLLTAASAPAAVPNPTNQARLDGTIRYLQEAQNPDGGFGGDSGKESGQGFSAWVALALAAGGINPRCQARPGGADAYSFLVNHFHKGLEEEIPWPKIPTTAFERELMVVNASGSDPHSFAGYDLVGEILARQQLDDGSFPYVPGGRGEINDTIFAIVALAPIQEPDAQAAIQHAADWLIAQQDDDGGWSWGVKGDPTEADLTGAAVQALRVAGRSDTEAEQKGLQYLHDIQNPDGGFPEKPGEAESNVASTAWAVQGIWAAEQDPETEPWVKGGNDPLSYMASLQQLDGHIRWKASQDLNGVWMTAYVAPAFAGQTWPIPAPPCSQAPPSAPPQPGQGEGTQSGKGTIAGGGGRGAPLFSRPKPQSKGKTPGGVRVLHGRSSSARNHSATRRGDNAVQPTVTTESEASNPDHRQLRRERLNRGQDGAGAGAVSAGAGAQQGSGREVTGTLIGGGAAGFGAPGLHSAGVSSGGTPWPAIAIGAGALLFSLGGSQLERRRGEAFS